MAGAGVHASELVFIVLLLLVIGFGAVAQRVGVPYPIVHVIGGLAVSLVPGVPRPVLEPDVVFLVFLPPLLYAGAWNTSWREFSRNLVDIASLPVGLVAVTVASVAVLAARILPGFDWRTGFVLGAVVSTTDAIAATSIARRMKLPRRVVDVLEGESLVNDATGLLALEFGVSLLASGVPPAASQAATRFAYLVVAGVGTGFALGAAVAWFERRVDNGPIEIAISIVVPYGTYLLAETVRASGVLAVVAAGLFLSRKSARFFSPTVRLQAHAFWEALNFILNGLVFLLIGLQLPLVLAGIEDSGPLRLIAIGAAFSGIVILLRLVGAFPAIGFAAFVRRRLLRQEMPAPPPRQVFVLGWTGMRGVIALAAALSLPNTVLGGARFAQRDEIVFITFCVILATLVVQGLSLPPVIRGLALEGVAKSTFGRSMGSPRAHLGTSWALAISHESHREPIRPQAVGVGSRTSRWPGTRAGSCISARRALSMRATRRRCARAERTPQRGGTYEGSCRDCGCGCVVRMFSAGDSVVCSRISQD